MPFDKMRRMKTLVRVAAITLLALVSAHSFAQGTSKKLAVLAKGAAEDGTWKWELQFWPGNDKCAGSGRRDCGTEVFYIQNDSADVIECEGFVEYKGVRGERQEFQTRIRANDSWSDPIILDAYGLAIKAQNVSCAKYVPEPALTRPEGCTAQSTGADLSDYYPKESQNIEETGLVRVRLTLAKPQGKATEVRVVDRSPFKRLDVAAVKFVKALTFTTTCAPTTFDMGIRFSIAE
jgi:TonB family protein